MSTLNVAKISDGTDTVETGYVVNGSAKAWCNYTSFSTTTLSDSLNVSSLTDSGVGLTDVNFSNAFANTVYASAGATVNFSVAIGNVSSSKARSSGFYVSGLGGQRAYYDTRVGNIYQGDLA